MIHRFRVEDVSGAQVSELRNLINDDLSDEQFPESFRHHYTDIILKRYMVATKMDIQRAAERIRENMSWRMKNSLDTILEGPPPDPKIRKFRPAAYLDTFSKTGCPIYVERPGKLNGKVLATFDKSELRHAHIYSQELGQRLCRERNARGILLIIDMTGLSLSAATNQELLKILKEESKIDERHYPETLEHVYVVNADWVFNTAFKVIKEFIDPGVLSKITILGGNFVKELENRVDTSQLPTFLKGSLEVDESDWMGCGQEDTNNEDLIKVELKGKPFEYKITVECPGDIIAWQFISEKKDISLLVSYNGIEGSGPEKVEVPVQKYAPDTIHSGSLICKEAGDYIVTWNTKTKSNGLSYKIYSVTDDSLEFGTVASSKGFDPMKYTSALRNLQDVFIPKLEELCKGNQSLFDRYSNHKLLGKFLRANELDVKSTLDHLQYDITWRIAENVDELSKRPVDPKLILYHPSGFAGRSKKGEPIYFDRSGRSKLKLLRNVPVTAYIQWIIWRHEESARIREESGADTMCIIIDAEGMSLADLMAPEMMAFMEWDADFEEVHYPESVGRVFVINASRIFTTLWRLLQGFIPQRTREKTVILGTNYEKVLLDYVDADQLPAYLKCGNLVIEDQWAGDLSYMASLTMDIEDMTTIQIPAWKAHKHRLEVAKGQGICWEILVEKHDIRFMVDYCPPGNCKPQLVVKECRIVAGAAVKYGFYDAVEPGIYELTFSNKHSTLTSKKIYFKAQVMERPDLEIWKKKFIISNFDDYKADIEKKFEKNERKRLNALSKKNDSTMNEKTSSFREGKNV